MTVRAHKTVGPVVFGVSLFNADGVCCYGTNTSIEELAVPEFEGEQTVTFRIREPGHGGGELQARRRRAPRGRLSRTTTTACSTASA